MEFKVKRSFLSILIFNLLLVFLVCVSIPFAYNTWVFIVVFAICFGLFCFYNTSVIFASAKIEKDVITYRTGAFKYEINTKNITKIEKIRSYCPSLATSFDRIRIVTNENGKHKFYYISINDEDKFIELVKGAEKIKEEKVEKVKEKPVAKKTATKKKTTKK